MITPSTMPPWLLLAGITTEPCAPRHHEVAVVALLWLLRLQQSGGCQGSCTLAESCISCWRCRGSRTLNQRRLNVAYKFQAMPGRLLKYRFSVVATGACAPGWECNHVSQNGCTASSSTRARKAAAARKYEKPVPQSSVIDAMLDARSLISCFR